MNPCEPILESMKPRLLPALRKELIQVGIERICSELLKSLLIVKADEWIQAKNRLNLPHELFSFKWEPFNERLNVDTLYLSVLELVCKDAIQKAKFCIILDEMTIFVNDALTGYRSNRMGYVIKEIRGAKKLLTIADTFKEEFIDNQKKLNMLNVLLEKFDQHAFEVNNETIARMYEAQNSLMERTIVMNKILFRTQLNYTDRMLYQVQYECIKVEDDMEDAVSSKETLRERELRASNWHCMRQSLEIDILKEKLAELHKKYDHDFEYYDGEIAYKSNMLDAMRNKYFDCKAKLKFFAIDLPNLLEWHIMREIQEREKVLLRIIGKKKKPKKKK